MELSRRLIICGAGVSRKEPACLPLGQPLTEFYIRHSCGVNIANRLIETTSDLSKNLGINVSIPRLETIIGAIDAMDVSRANSNKQYRMIDGFKSFAHAPINENHIILAEMLLGGTPVITFNFDKCIEKAMEVMIGEDIVTKKAFDIYQSVSKNRTPLYHLHGTCEIISSLGATLSSVSKGIPNRFANEFDRLLERTDEIVVLGYSFSDYFDFVPLFKDRQQLIKNKKLIYVNHEGFDTLIEEKLKRMFKELHFDIVSIDTTAFLRNIHGTCNQTSKIDQCFNWEREFLKELSFKYNDDEKLLNTVQIGSIMGIMPTILLNQEWLQVFHRLKYLVYRKPTDKLLGLISSVANDNGDIKCYYFYREQMNNRTRNLASEAEDIRKYVPQSDLSQLQRECRRNIKIHFRHILDIRSYYTVVFDSVDETILETNDLKYSELSIETQELICNLLSLLDYLYQKRYGKFSGVSQYGAIIAARYLLLAIKYGVGGRIWFRKKLSSTQKLLHMRASVEPICML